MQEMPRTKSRSKNKKKTRTLASRWHSTVERCTPSPTMLRVMRAFGWTSLLTGAVLLAWLGLPALQARAIARTVAATPPEGVRVVFVDPPSVLDDDELRKLTTTVRRAMREHASPLLHEGLDATPEALMATGWFETIHQVAWKNDGSVHVDAEYVVPVAVVRTARGDDLVDSQARRLDLTYRAGYAPLPVIVHASQPAPDGFGETWLGGDVQAGLALLRRIQGEPWFKQVAAIDVERFQNEGLLAFRTHSCTILWGRSPDQATVQEVPVHQKLEYLTYLFRQYGAIDAACGGGELDIRRDVVTTGAPS